MSEDLDLERVHIATNCPRVVREIEAPKNLGGHCMVFHEIKERSNLFRACLFSHEQRECNEEPHRLARMATSLDIGRHVWLDAPPAHLCIPVSIELRQ